MGARAFAKCSIQNEQQMGCSHLCGKLSKQHGLPAVPFAKCGCCFLFIMAGDWHHSAETMPTGSRPHMMRVMLISNLAVDQRFANGPCIVCFTRTPRNMC